MTNAKLLILAAGAALALTLTGCSSNGTPTVDDVLGPWGAPETQGEPSLVFEDDGTYHGNDGCNVVGGSYMIDGDGTIDLGAMHSTMMFCEGVEVWLSTSATAKLEDAGELTFFDEGGAEVGKLPRA